MTATKEKEVPKVKATMSTISITLEEHPWIIPVGFLAVFGGILGVLCKSSMRDVDANIPVDLTNDQFTEANDILRRKNQATLLDRSPGLMGFLTLGISNLFTNGDRNVEETIFELRRNNPDLVKKIDAFSANEHKKMVDLQDYHVQKRRSQGHEAMTSNVVNGAATVARLFSK